MTKSHASTNVPKWLAFTDRAEAVFAKFEKLPIPIGAKGASDVHLYGYALLARTASNFHGLMILVREGMVVEARTLARSCIENSFYIVKLLKEGEPFLEKILEADAASRDRRGQFMLEQGIKLDDDVKQRLQTYLKESRRAKPKPQSLEPKGVALKGPFLQKYLAYTQLSDDAAHTSKTSLDRYVKRGGGKAVLSFKPVETNEEMVDTIVWASLGSLGTFLAGTDMFKLFDLNKEVASLCEEYHALANSDGQL